jgi:MFS family permease
MTECRPHSSKNPDRRMQYSCGPWRAVFVLGVTQILAWGTIIYTPVLILPLIAIERGWSMTFAMAGLSIGLFVAGLVARFVGKSIDRFGGHRIMLVGSLLGSVGLLGLVYATSKVAYVIVWIVLGAALAASLYDAAFATLGRIFGNSARSPITAVTLAGGLSSTVSWPITHVLVEAVGWRGAYFVYAGLLASVAAPLHAFALPRSRSTIANLNVASYSVLGDAPMPSKGRPFILTAAGFAAYAFVPSALSAHLLAIFGRHGLDATSVVAIGTLFGPAQVAARICELAFGRNFHPLWVVRHAIAALVIGFALLASFGFSAPVAAAFAIIFGGANGLITICRGTVPLALFGSVGYGHLMGRIAMSSLLMQAAAPLVLALVAEHLSDPGALAITAGFSVLALACFAMVPRQGGREKALS